jgi:hypothetical protein
MSYSLRQREVTNYPFRAEFICFNYLSCFPGSTEPHHLTHVHPSSPLDLAEPLNYSASKNFALIELATIDRCRYQASKTSAYLLTIVHSHTFEEVRPTFVRESTEHPCLRTPRIHLLVIRQQID